MSRIRIARLSLAAALAVAAPVVRAAEPYQIHEKVLPNGLRIVTLEDRSCPVVAVQVWYHVGSKDEKANRTGFAHMFEHMMFRGTDRLGPEDHFEFIRASGGDCNAYTAFDNTTYVQTVPKNQLAMVLWLEAERMAALRVDEEGFAVERKVVEEERRLGLNQPYGTVMEDVLAQVFKQHPYRWSPIGSIEHLRASTSEELLRFWETYYVPNNATLVVVGDVEHAAVEAEAERAFGWIPRCADPPRVTAKEPLFEEPLEIRLKEERGPVPIVAAAYRTVPKGHEDALALEMLTSILGGGESSRLYKKVVDEEEKAAMAMAAAMGLEDEGFAAAGAVMLPFGDLDGTLKLIDAEVERVKAEPVSEGELAKAKSNFLRQLVDESMTVESKAQLLGSAVLFEGGAGTLNERAEKIEAMTAADLQTAAKKYFTPERRVTLRIEPTLGGMVKTLFGGLAKKAEPDAEEAPKEKPATSTMAKRAGPKAEAKRPEGYPEHAPVAAALDARVPLDAVSKRLENGLEVVVVENHEAPLVAVTLGLLNGAFLDLPEHPGAASMACSMLTKGTAAHTAQELAEELESHAVELGAAAGMDSAAVRGSAVTGQLGRLVRLLAEVTLRPTFPEKEFKKLKNQALTGMAIGEKQPATIAEREFQKVLYGDHFYGREASGTSADVKKLTAAACAEWWQRCARPDQATLYFAGDVKPEDAFELAEAFFGDWSADGEPPAARVAALPKQDANRIVLIDVPGSVQSQIRVGQLAFARNDARTPIARVLSQVFGGAFNSRLNETIRVKKGLTYGARGGIGTQRFGGSFYVSTFSKTRTTAEAVAAILEEVVRLKAEPPSEKELTQAQSYLVGSFAGDHETPGSIAGELWSLKVNGLGKDHPEQALAAIRKATADDVAQLARALVDEKRLAIVVVGDAEQIQAELEKIAPVTVLDEEGKPKAKQAKPERPGDGGEDGE